MHHLPLLLLAFVSSTASVNVEEFMENKRWGCSRNGGNCFNVDPRTGNNDCPEDAKSYICRPGFYEALDGTCQVVTLHCHQDALDNRTNLERCAGCRLGDRPEGEEGQVELGCLDAEATCMRDFNENAYCREAEKRYICARGYYRAMPENRCYKNANVQRDKSIPKDGCVDLFRSLCRPNSHPVCETSDVEEDLGPNCKLVGEKHEGPVNRAGPLNDNCTGSIYCKCDPGFVREHPEKYAKCIPREHCVERPCQMDNEEFANCPQRYELDCAMMVHLEDCNGTHKLESNHLNGFQCPDGKPVCFGPPACLCKEGYFRLYNQCVDFDRCVYYHKYGVVRVGGPDQAFRLMENGH